MQMTVHQCARFSNDPKEPIPKEKQIVASNRTGYSNDTIKGTNNRTSKDRIRNHTNTKPRNEKMNAESNPINQTTDSLIQSTRRYPTTATSNKVLQQNPELAAVFQVWKDYEAWHSEPNLLEEWYQSNETTLHHRRFTIGFYSCPQQAGNRLHHFLNALIWAIVTNRTLLWHYYDRNACRVFGADHSRAICEGANTEKDCNRVLKRASWIPGYVKWAKTIPLDTPRILSYWATHEPSPGNKRWRAGDERYAGVVDTVPGQVVVFSQMLGQDSSILHNPRKRDLLLRTQGARQRANDLFAMGADFVYGLLLRESFLFQPKFVQNLQPLAEEIRKTNVTIAIHSRHSIPTDDGANIRREVRCLEEMLQNSSLQVDLQSSCRIGLMSDRPATLQKLHDYLQRHFQTCLPVVAPHEAGTSFAGKEHGPFAGIGFYQDLYIASQASHGFIGSRYRSSSLLVREWMEYDHHLRAFQQGHYPPPNLVKCYLD